MQIKLQPEAMGAAGLFREFDTLFVSGEAMGGASRGVTAYYRLASDRVDGVAPGRVLLPGDILKSISRVIDGEIQINTTTRRVVVSHDSTTWKLKPIKSNMPAIPAAQQVLLSVRGEDLFKMFKSISIGQTVGFYLSPDRCLARSVLADPFMSAEIKIAAECSTDTLFALSTDQLSKLMPFLWASAEDTVVVGTAMDGQATVFSTGKWDICIQNALLPPEGTLFGDDPPMHIIGRVSDLTHIFKIAAICEGVCKIHTEDGRLYMESNDETSSASCSVQVEGALPPLRVNPAHMLHALKACAMWDDTVYVGATPHRVRIRNSACCFEISVPSIF